MIFFAFCICYQLFNKGWDRSEVITSFTSWIMSYKGALRGQLSPHSYSIQDYVLPEPSVVGVCGLRDSHERRSHTFELNYLLSSVSFSSNEVCCNYFTPESQNTAKEKAAIHFTSTGTYSSFFWGRTISPQSLAVTLFCKDRFF